MEGGEEATRVKNAEFVSRRHHNYNQKPSINLVISYCLALAYLIVLVLL